MLSKKRAPLVGATKKKKKELLHLIVHGTQVLLPLILSYPRPDYPPSGLVKLGLEVTLHGVPDRPLVPQAQSHVLHGPIRIELAVQEPAQLSREGALDDDGDVDVRLVIELSAARECTGLHG